MVDFTNMDNNALIALSKEIEKELHFRQQDRFRELTMLIADTLNTLREEFPTVYMMIEDVQCEECRVSTDIDLFDFFNHFDHTMFKF